MKLIFFVKDDCGACKNAKEKVDFFLDKWGALSSVDVETISLSTSDGLVEAAMRAVAEIPTIILEDHEEEVARWMKKAPTSDDLRAKLGV
jgi:glutaredoxin